LLIAREKQKVNHDDTTSTKQLFVVFVVSSWLPLNVEESNL